MSRGFEKTCGVIAQLGERLHGMQEVVGSIPSGSTTLFDRPETGWRVLPTWSVGIRGSQRLVPDSKLSRATAATSAFESLVLLALKMEWAK